MQNSINERIKILIDSYESSVPARFAKKLGVSASVVGNYLPGSQREGEPSFTVLQKILAAYPQVSIKWLIEGKGKMEGDQDEQPEHTIKVFANGTEKKHELQAIPLYDITAAAGLNALHNSKQNILDYLSIPNLARCDGAIYIKGDSMYPLLKHGDIVAFQQITDVPDDIYFGEMYVVDLSTAHREKIVVKYVQKSEKGEEYVKLVSYNDKHHPAKDVHVSKIRAMAEVKASIRLT